MSKLSSLKLQRLDVPTWKQGYEGGAYARKNKAKSQGRGLIQALSTEYVGNADSSTRILIFSSNYDASVEISFLRPVRFSPQDFCAALLDDAQINRLETDGLNVVFDLFKPTHVIFCRYWGNYFEQAMELARAVGAATLSFLDDNLLAVPPETGKATFEFFQDKARQRIIADSIGKTDLFIPSTPMLAEVMKTYRKGPMAEWPLYRTVAQSEVGDVPQSRSYPTIGYMASSSHIGDITAHLPALMSLMEDRADLHIEFFGTILPLPQLSVFGNRVVSHAKANSYDDFMARLHKMGWWVGLAPLKANDYNKTKACTKWVEYSLAGIPTLVQSPDVYSEAVKADACVLARPEAFLSAIEGLLDDAGRRKKLVDTSHKLIVSHFNMNAHVNQLREALVFARSLSAKT
ncbi:MAG: hypothetical protein QM645_03600 [Asticcacaulis sp.]